MSNEDQLPIDPPIQTTTIKPESPEDLKQALHALQAENEALSRAKLHYETLHAQAAEALQEKARELQLMANHMGSHISRLDRDLRYLFVNDHCEALFGKSREQLLGSTMRESLEPKLLAYIEPHIRSALAGERASFEAQFKTLQGERVFWKVNFVPDRNAQGQVVGFFNITQDLTPHKQVERKLRESEARTKLLLEAANVGLWDWNLRTGALYFSPEWKGQLGYADHELPHHFEEWESRLHPADRDKTLDAVNNFVEGRNASYEQEFRLCHRDGSYRWILAQANLIRRASGKAERMMGSHIDITERKQAEARLRESDLALRAISQGVIITGPDQRIRWVNEAFTSITGYSLEDVLGRNCRLLQGSLTDPRVVAVIHEALEKGEGFSGEILNYRKDGTTHWNDLSISPARDEEGQLLSFIGITRDITMRKQAQQERELLDRKMQEAQKLESLGVLAGGIAHDFNNLLTSILGNASILDLELQDSALRDYSTQIVQTSRRAADLCRQMLAYSGRGRFVVKPIDLSRLVEETAQLLHVSISKKAKLTFQLEKGLPTIAADVTQLQQVIVNLVINASEALGEKSGVITLSTGLVGLTRESLVYMLGTSELLEGQYLFLEVTDNGCGMSEETQAKIFEPFFTTKFTGRGLGLAAVLGIVRGHKGALTVRSVQGQGSTFTLLFPATSDPTRTSAESPSFVAPTPEKLSVLVVDDDPLVTKTTHRILRHLGFDPVLASGGREALEIFGAEPERFALVLLDLTMPEMDGLETFAALKQIASKVRVVLMSGYNQQESMDRFLGKKPVGFLEKPFSVESLREMVQKALQ